MIKIPFKRIDLILLVVLIVLGVAATIDSLLLKDYLLAATTFVMMLSTGLVVLQSRAIKEFHDELQVKKALMEIQSERLMELQKQLKNKEGN